MRVEYLAGRLQRDGGVGIYERRFDFYVRSARVTSEIAMIYSENLKRICALDCLRWISSALIEKQWGRFTVRMNHLSRTHTAFPDGLRGAAVPLQGVTCQLVVSIKSEWNEGELLDLS